MTKVLALQQLKAAEIEPDPGGGTAPSNGSSTCSGCSCTSNGCGTRGAL